MCAKETAYIDKCYHPVLYDDFTFSEKLLYTTEKICDTCTNVLHKKGLLMLLSTAKHC